MIKKILKSILGGHGHYSSSDYKRHYSHKKARHYSSSDYKRHHSYKKTPHHGSYGHHHYKRKHKSGSFFSSFFSS
ncbi:hypothetical protein [Priestia abyssalis]|uniref:hypothetical protein n=1 Tax=Priestia abyssalis TaxID=1221450 RepID=UPI000994F4EB|nr:hypothetical protein [Priestia abyssalis]